MSHRSRLAGFIIDCRTDDLDAAARFWSDALGLPIGALPPEEASTYAKLDGVPGDLHVEVQKVKHDSRVHLDIETDDMRHCSEKRTPRAFFTSQVRLMSGLAHGKAIACAPALPKRPSMAAQQAVFRTAC